jgi:hypothetical protein
VQHRQYGAADEIGGTNIATRNAVPFRSIEFEERTRRNGHETDKKDHRVERVPVSPELLHTDRHRCFVGNID